MGKRNMPPMHGQRRCQANTFELPKNKKWRMQFMNEKWLCINEELAYKKIVNCTNKAHTIHLEEYLDKVKHKWESRVRKE
jgi:hypothetical protein